MSCDEHHCITCADEGVPMRVLRLDAARGLALCETGAGERSSVETALVDPVSPGDRLLVHAGTALARLEEEPARAGPSPGAEPAPASWEEPARA